MALLGQMFSEGNRAMFKRVGVMSSALSLGAAAVFGFGVVSPAQADTAPADANEPKTVSSDPLPTAQIDGVAWTQAVVGDRVFVGGSFTTARPAGSPAGTNTDPRANIMAFDINTGALDQNFKPVFDGQILSMALSPDKSTLYVGGDFTKVDGQWRVRLAAFDTATGQLKANFRPVAGSTVRTLAANDNTVFAGTSRPRVTPRAWPPWHARTWRRLPMRRMVPSARTGIRLRMHR